MVYVEYDIRGKIVRCLFGSEDTIKANIQLEYIEADESIDDELFFVDTESKTLELKQDYHIGSLPLPCSVMIEGQTYRVTEQPEFEFDTPGTYIINVVPESPQYLEKEFEYVVEA